MPAQWQHVRCTWIPDRFLGITHLGSGGGSEWQPSSSIADAMDPAMVPGDDGAITAILALQDGSIVPGGKTLHEGYEAAVFTVSSALSDAKFRVKAETGRAADLAQARASVAGVSLHEEMASLSQAERAFQASARVVQTADQLYETLLQMV